MKLRSSKRCKRQTAVHRSESSSESDEAVEVHEVELYNKLYTGYKQELKRYRAGAYDTEEEEDDDEVIDIESTDDEEDSDGGSAYTSDEDFITSDEEDDFDHASFDAKHRRW